MAELNLKQITDRLNAEFTGDTRKLVFWYDDNAEFAKSRKMYVNRPQAYVTAARIDRSRPFELRQQRSQHEYR